MAVLNIKDFPPGLYKALRVRAKREGRSLAQRSSTSCGRRCRALRNCRFWNCGALVRSCGRRRTAHNMYIGSEIRGIDI